MTAERTVIVQHPEGLHARPAALFVQTANRFASTIELEAAGRTSNGKSIVGILKLGVRQGQSLTVRARGDDAAAAVEGLTAVLAGTSSAETP